MPPVVTFTTDFGTRDSFVGTMKGVVLSRCPDAYLVDLTHEIPPQQVRIGAMRLASAAPYFPPKTVHLAVVDPGVGSERRPVAISAYGQIFVGPDNGLLSLAAPSTAEAWRAVELTEPSFWQQVVSTTFHGRDIFAPVAAALAAGVPLDEVGRPIDSIIVLEDFVPRRIGSSVEGVVADVDRFGNLITNVRRSDLGGLEVVRVEVAAARIDSLSATYDPTRSLVALINSDGWLEVAAPLGSAADALQVGVGSGVRVEVRPRAGETAAGS
jgi:S-adenosylmethionine hydrolase